MSNKDFYEKINELEKYFITDAFYDLKCGNLDYFNEFISSMKSFLNEKEILSEKEFDELELKSLKLDALESGGVDNWEWYYESLSENKIISIDGEEYSYLEYLEEKDNV